MDLPEALRETLWWLTAWQVRALGLLIAAALAGSLRVRGASAAKAALLSANAFAVWLCIPFPLMAAVAYLAGYSPPVTPCSDSFC